MEPQNGTADSYRVYPARWAMLGIFCLQTMTNAALWITFAPIASLTAEFFLGSSTHLHVSMVNMLSLCFMFLYLPGSIAASYIMERHGLRSVVVIGACLNFVSSAIRYVSVYAVRSSTAGCFSLLMVGQCIGGLAQPLFTNVPVKLSGTWFSTRERDVATVIAALSNPLGNALGQVLPAIFVAAPKREGGGVTGMYSLLLTQCVWTGVVSLVCACFFRKAPPTPPSRSNEVRQLTRESSRAMSRALTQSQGSNLSRSGSSVEGGGRPRSVSKGMARAFVAMKEDVLALVSDKNFVILVFGFGVGLGLFNALLTCIEQLVKPCGYNSDDAGIFGGALIGAGTIGAGLAGFVLDATHAYRSVLKGGFALTFVGVLVFCEALRPAQFSTVTAAFGVLGLFMMPLYPVTLEAAVECTYPIPEEASGGALLLMGQLSGIGFTFGLAELIHMRNEYQDIYSPANWFIVSIVAACTLIIFQFNGQYKRLEHDRRKSAGFTSPKPGSGNALMGATSIAEPLIQESRLPSERLVARQNDA